MDPITNLREQLELARAIESMYDERYKDGLSDKDAQEIASKADRLSELVIALHEWRKKGGFDPYVTHTAMQLA